MTNKYIEQFKKDVEKLLQENISLSETKGKIITDMLVEGLIDCDDANKMLLDESIDANKAEEIKYYRLGKKDIAAGKAEPIENFFEELEKRYGAN